MADRKATDDAEVQPRLGPVFGADQPDLAWTLVNLAVLVRRDGRRAEADELFQRARCVLQGRVAPEHPLLVKLNRRLASLHGTTEVRVTPST